MYAADGYMLNEFLSPITNRRTNAYGGGFQNRIRILMEVNEAVREDMSKGMPPFLRMNSTKWMEESDVRRELGSWDVQSILRLVRILPGPGMDLLDRGK